MTTMKGLSSAGQRYYQLSLSGQSVELQQENENSDSAQNEQEKAKRTQEGFRKAKGYKVNVTFVVIPAEFPNSEHLYQIHLNDNSDLLITPIAPNGKADPRQAVSVAQKKARKTYSIRMVYGISEDGKCSLSPATIGEALPAISELSGQVLGKIATAVERALFFTEDQKGSDDTRSSNSSTLPPENLGKPEKRRRGKKIRGKIRDEDLSEETTDLVEK